MILNLTNRFILLLDVETANDTDCAIVYDIGFIIMDIYGNIYETGSFVIRDVFCYERELMESAYYADKIPEYISDLRAGKRKMMDFMAAWHYINNLMKKYDCHTVAAYNCNFDKNALNNTLRYLSKSKYRWFFPYGTEFICIWNMACNSICETGEYRTFAELNRFYSNHEKNYKATAETVYAFISDKPNFNEEHKGMEDVRIECEIMKECLCMNDAMMSINRGCWNKVKRGALCLAQ